MNAIEEETEGMIGTCDIYAFVGNPLEILWILYNELFILHVLSLMLEHIPAFYSFQAFYLLKGTYISWSSKGIRRRKTCFLEKTNGTH